MGNTPRIILIEDDPAQAEWIADQIAKFFPTEEMGAYLRYFDSENRFTQAVAHLGPWQPQFALIDRSINYYSADEVKKIPPNVDFNSLPDAHMAWSRCRDALLRAWPQVRVAVMTVHDSVPGTNVGDVIIQKGDDGMVTKLGQFLHSSF